MPILPDCELIIPGHGLSWDVDVERPHLARSLSMTIHRDEISGADRVRILVKSRGRIIGRHTSHLGDVRHRVTIPLTRLANDVQIVFRTRYAVTEFRFRAVRPTKGTSARARPRAAGPRRSGP
jgi:hypothetical protein